MTTVQRERGGTSVSAQREHDVDDANLGEGNEIRKKNTPSAPSGRASGLE